MESPSLSLERKDDTRAERKHCNKSTVFDYEEKTNFAKSKAHEVKFVLNPYLAWTRKSGIKRDCKILREALQALRSCHCLLWFAFILDGLAHKNFYRSLLFPTSDVHDQESARLSTTTTCTRMTVIGRPGHVDVVEPDLTQRSAAVEGLVMVRWFFCEGPNAMKGPTGWMALLVDVVPGIVIATQLHKAAWIPAFKKIWSLRSKKGRRFDAF